MKDGIIDLDTPRGKKFGFTSDKFDGWLWKAGNYIYISFIVSKQPGRGHLSQLFNAILSKGYGIKVPTPSALMQTILAKKGFARKDEFDERIEEVYEVWVKEPKEVTP